jgi:apolipoprotein N-acyltransferase
VADKQTLRRTALFTVTLFAVLIASALGKNTIAGQLGAAPLLPLFALFTIATGDGALTKLKSSKVTVPLGPVFAMAFVSWFAEKVYQADVWHGLLAMIAGWSVCFISIVAVNWFISLSDRTTNERF